MPEYSSNYTSGYVRGGINRYRRRNIAGQVAGGILGAAAVGLAGYGIYKGAQAIARIIKTKHALNLKARGIVEESGLPQTKLQRRIVRARLTGKEDKERRLQLKSDERTNRMTGKSIRKHDRQTERKAKKYMRKQKWELFRQDWRDAMKANTEEYKSGIDKLNIFGHIKDKIQERQKQSGKYEGMTRKEYRDVNREREAQESIIDADKIMQQTESREGGRLPSSGGVSPVILQEREKAGPRAKKVTTKKTTKINPLAGGKGSVVVDIVNNPLADWKVSFSEGGVPQGIRKR